jgi:hypothetical protein
MAGMAGTQHRVIVLSREHHDSAVLVQALTDAKQFDFIKLDVEGEEKYLMKDDESKAQMCATMCLFMELHERFVPGSEANFDAFIKVCATAPSLYTLSHCTALTLCMHVAARSHSVALPRAFPVYASITDELKHRCGRLPWSTLGTGRSPDSWCLQEGCRDGSKFQEVTRSGEYILVCKESVVQQVKSRW